jgi:hypothetical protein
MKYILFHILLTVLIIFTSLESVYNLTFNDKLRAKVRNKLKSRKNEAKIKIKAKSVLKKNGPLTWENLSEDGVLETLIKAESEGVDSMNLNNNNYNMKENINDMNEDEGIVSHSVEVNNRTHVIVNNNNIPPNLNNVPSFMGGKATLSDNQRSKTFRTVSPFEDSTVNFKGKKYSKLFKNLNPSNVKTGFYGKSRLTRF